MNLLNHDEGYFIWEIIIFFIFIILLKKAVWKPVTTYLNERRNVISDSLASIEKARVAVDQLKKEAELLNKKTLDEISALQKDTKEFNEKVLSEAKIKAKLNYDLIIEDALLYIQKLKVDAIVEIKNKTGILVIEIADKVLRKELAEPGKQEELSKRLIDKIEFKSKKVK
ncbi:F0F1 ATP synthase subunit B [Sediminibacterium sp.]|uniref:F0F1 ATP synthase subunit B family protein n=1 Tax=Sediminibacterium sp. TaxID=1917865 RepID=UPI00272FF2AB|nr:F0F1 ATP synthase subunit B [Sediminibacterium sp.]MDP2421370.1 F0F1 ATP synthase subunit B [Sediminibacterium sp.]